MMQESADTQVTHNHKYFITIEESKKMTDILKSLAIKKKTEIYNYLSKYIETPKVESRTDYIRSISGINNGGSDKNLKLFPLLPKNATAVDTSRIQLIDYTNSRAAFIEMPKTISDTSSIGNFFNYTANTIVDYKLDPTQNNNGIWALRFTGEQYKQLINAAIPDSIRDLLRDNTIPDGISLIDIDLPAGIDTTKTQITFGDPISGIDASILDSSDFNYLYVFDLFNTKDACPHGNKVLNVINQTLKSLLPDTLVSKLENKIEWIPINYFQNRKRCDDIIDQFLEQTFKEKEKAYVNSGISKERIQYYYDFSNPLKALKNMKSQNSEKVPDLFLRVLFDYVNMSAKPADIISTSFTVRFPFNKMIKDFNDKSTLYITAALNEYQDIESFIEIKDSNGLTEPLHTYYDRNKVGSDKTSCFIIGGGTSGGMFSKAGSGITGIGHYTGWNEKKLNNYCIQYTDCGNSYATPEVSTLLWIARAYWKKKGMTLTPEDAKYNYLVSADINKGTIARFGSGGLTNLKKLFNAGISMIEDSTGKINSISIKDTSYLLYKGNTYRFGNNLNDENFNKTGGIYVVGDTLYYFSIVQMKWVPLPIDKVQLLLSFSDTNNTTYTITSAKEFTDTYKSLIITR